MPGNNPRSPYKRKRKCFYGATPQERYIEKSTLKG